MSSNVRRTILVPDEQFKPVLEVGFMKLDERDNVTLGAELLPWSLISQIHMLHSGNPTGAL